ncbi:MAG: hypothetical protein NWS47_01835 [Alphaproteobacteria bacterium]|nr:hypothetical protein [Alphaproteobacteria bacterium]
MTVQNKETQPQEENHWFVSQLFRTLLITGAINLILWGGVITALPFFGPEIENILFPSIKKIQVLRSELDRVHLIQDEKSKALATLTDQTQKELATLNESLNKLSDQVKALHDRVSIPTAGLAVSGSSEIVAQWNSLLEHFSNGDPFIEQLRALDPFIAKRKDILEAAHELINAASKKTRPFKKLTADLVVIKEKLVRSKHTNDNNPSTNTKDQSWIDSLWEKAKSHISFERTDQAAIKAASPSTKETLIKTIEEAISLIEKHQFDAAIKTIKEQQAISKTIFDRWLSDADVRLSVEQKVETLRQRLTPLLTKKVN